MTKENAIGWLGVGLQEINAAVPPNQQSTNHEDVTDTNKQQYVTPKLVALFFAASWCPDCTPVVPLIKEMRCAASGPYANKFATTQAAEDRHVRIVIVPSEGVDGARALVRSQSDAPDLWEIVEVVGETPFGGDSAAAVKAKFSICASKESSGLGIGARKGGLPSLVVLDARDGKVVDGNGMSTLESKGAKQAVETWMQAV